MTRPATVPRQEIVVRSLERGDLPAVARIDALHTGRVDTSSWERAFARLFDDAADGPRVGIAAQSGGRLVGYLLGEVRAFEFGSGPCGWVFAVGVSPGSVRRGVASRLLEEACRRFREAGIGSVRTMVRRNDVPVLSFFRSNGFVAGRFFELERELGGAS